MKQGIRSQRGIGLIGLLFIFGLIATCVTIALKLGPHYMEYLTVRSVMNDLSEDPAFADLGKRSILSTVGKRLDINAVDDVDLKAFKYKKTKGGYELSVEYQVQEHLFSNLDAVMTFDHKVQVSSGK